MLLSRGGRGGGGGGGRRGTGSLEGSLLSEFLKATIFSRYVQGSLFSRGRYLPNFTVLSTFARVKTALSKHDNTSYRGDRLLESAAFAHVGSRFHILPPTGRFPFDQKFRKFREGSEWNRHFPEFHSEILGVPREVGLKFRKIGIAGKLCSIRPSLLGPSFSEP